MVYERKNLQVTMSHITNYSVKTYIYIHLRPFIMSHLIRISESWPNFKRKKCSNVTELCSYLLTRLETCNPHWNTESFYMSSLCLCILNATLSWNRNIEILHILCNCYLFLFPPNKNMTLSGGTWKGQFLILLHYLHSPANDVNYYMMEMLLVVLFQPFSSAAVAYQASIIQVA
jgi:hypothetical protein